ncbi:dihydrofolate reductase [Agrobacterium rosae]|uniref:Dihydrofolate reductase n=1 Tax=Agrobacterium rosae TaxID=1972867 RepID=A0A1R3T844_9HYPH|nr:dihydrofolate reductase [Agrobacterium rosae]SCX03431.1 Dihydrofolate reductase type 3 [Agrobacterium rosae]
MTQPRITLIAAVSENGVIGRDLDMPWKLSTDLKRFKALTMGKPMIMGRKTFLSVGERPLPGRPHIIISRDPDYHPQGVDVVSSLEDALSLAKEKAQALGVDEIFVAGGGEIYRQALPFADQLSVTHVEVSLEGDTFFPAIDPTLFEKIDETAAPAGDRDNYPVRFVTYRRYHAVQ